MISKSIGKDSAAKCGHCPIIKFGNIWSVNVCFLSRAQGGKRQNKLFRLKIAKNYTDHQKNENQLPSVDNAPLSNLDQMERKCAQQHSVFSTERPKVLSD